MTMYYATCTMILNLHMHIGDAGLHAFAILPGSLARRPIMHAPLPVRRERERESEFNLSIQPALAYEDTRAPVSTEPLERLS